MTTTTKTPPTPSQSQTKDIINKDVNEYLKEWRAQELPQEAQIKRVQDALDASKTFVETISTWAGEQGDAEAVNKAFDVIGRLSDVELAFYTNRLRRALKIPQETFNRLLKAKRRNGNGKKGGTTDGELHETVGGYYRGWLIEYVYDPEDGTAHLVYRDPDRKIGVSDKLTIDGTTFVPLQPYAYIERQAVLFPSRLVQNPYPTISAFTTALIDEIETFLGRWYLFSSAYQKRLITYYVLLTWLYDAFEAVPYLRAIGEAGSGKSELMQRVGHICYRLIIASGSNTAATFFRTVEMFRGTVLVDEADLEDGGDMSNAIVKFLNLGAMRGNPITRLEEVMDANGRKTYRPMAYQTFGPKLIAMRKDFLDDAVGSRSLTFRVMERSTRELLDANVPIHKSRAFRREALELRNKLLRWRMEMWEEEIPTDNDLIDVNISARLNQVMSPIKALAKGDPTLLRQIEMFLRNYQSEIISDRSESLAAYVVEAMWKIYGYDDLHQAHVYQDREDGEYLLPKDIARITNEIMDEINDDGSESEDENKGPRVKSRRIGSVLKQLGVKRLPRKEHGIPVLWDFKKMQALAEHYGVQYRHLPRVQAALAEAEAADPEPPDEEDIRRYLEMAEEDDL